MSACQAAVSIEPDAWAAGAWDSDEALLWTIMRMFEVQASAQYHAHVPESPGTISCSSGASSARR